MLQSLRSQLNKHRAELKHVLEMLQTETQRLQEVKLEQDQRLDQLEKSQDSLLKVSTEMRAVQQEVLQQRSEVERHRKKAELEQARLEDLRKEVESVRYLRDESANERSRLQEQCRNLEARCERAQRGFYRTESLEKTCGGEKQTSGRPGGGVAVVQQGT